MPLSKQLRHWALRLVAPKRALREQYDAFKTLLDLDKSCLERIATLEEAAYGIPTRDWVGLQAECRLLLADCRALAATLIEMHPGRYGALAETVEHLGGAITRYMVAERTDPQPPFVLELREAAGDYDRCGGKAANLGRVKVDTDIPVPRGMVITANAYRAFLDQAGIRDELDMALARVDLDRETEFESLCTTMQRMVLEAPLPADLSDLLVKRARKLAEEKTLLALRSSAVAEDGQLSFAGQYESYLNVGPGDVCDVYKSVLAAKYAPKAVAYRVRSGLADDDAPMAVLVMPMVDARTAGVIYTLDYDRTQAVGGVLALYAAQGLGEDLVSGKVTPEVYSLSREEEPMLLQEPDGAVQLSEAEAEDLGRMGMALERFFDQPQDVEWAWSDEKGMVLLQSRPLQQQAVAEGAMVECRPDNAVYVSDAERVCAGVGYGTVMHVKDPARLREVEQGAVLVSESMDPALSWALKRASAVVTQSGSRASHLGSVAREQGVPMLTGVADVFAALPEGAEATVDALTGTVYEGRAGCLLEAVRTAQHEVPDSPVRKRLGEVISMISPLTLLDPQAEYFSPEGCTSLHDVVRFAHEKSVAEMFSSVGRSGWGMGGSRKLETGIPLFLYVVDMGEGLRLEGGKKKDATLDDVTSRPLLALWDGLTADDSEWEGATVYRDWEAEARMSETSFIPEKDLASYAVLDSDYLHLITRFGYHFAIVNTMCGHVDTDNYILFRFKGGGGDQAQRELRLQFIVDILERFGFECRVQGDMLDARYARGGEKVVQERLRVVGRLLSRTKVMDMSLHDASQVRGLVDSFLSLRPEWEAYK